MAVRARRDIRHPKKEILDRLVNQKVLFSPSIFVKLGILNFEDLLLILQICAVVKLKQML